MKKIIATLAAALFALALNAQVIYVVDMQQVHANYYKAKTALSNLNSAAERSKEELAKFDAQIQVLQKELEAIIAKLNNPALTEDAKRKISTEEGAPKEQAYRSAITERENWIKQTQAKIQSNAQQIREAHLKEIREAIKKIGEQKNSDFIFEKGVVYFSKPAVDITEDVIAFINAGNK